MPDMRFHGRVIIVCGIIVCGILAMLWCAAASASALERLVMPGEVIQGHAKYEDDCDKCHEPFSKKSQRRLCLDCHKDTAEDIRRQTGLHGRDATIREVECKQCHSDHLGRGADIVQFNRDLFDHAQSDYPLRGAHGKLLCSACHKTGEPYRKAPSDCFSCHKTQDVHRDRFGKDCARCHQEDRWMQTRFDHDKTKFALTGKHKETSCALCHPAQRYKDVPQQCIECHRLNDVHRGRYGEKCADCHATKGWKGYHYDHDSKTKFALRGKHKEARCDSCHKNDYKQKLKTQCDACHKEQDIHKGVLGQKCGDCHGEASWREHRFEHARFKETPCHDCHKQDDEHQGRYGGKCGDCHKVQTWREDRYDHDAKTKFPLRGKHKETACRNCHRGEAASERKKIQCHQCHALDDVHREKQGKECQRCHNERGWRDQVRFDHDMSRFPLIGLHATVPCEECHLNAGYRETQQECKACHARRDVHKGGLGPKCGQCHNPNSWKFWQFDHDRQTKYRLEGAHKEISCESCHKQPVLDKITLPRDCLGCHRGDDIHGGSFGGQCERCHNIRAFREISLRP